jgi:DNA-binding NtrC family response regulator
MFRFAALVLAGLLALPPLAPVQAGQRSVTCGWTGHVGGITGVTLKDLVKAFRVLAVQQAIVNNAGNVTEAARELGISRGHVYEILKGAK